MREAKWIKGTKRNFIREHRRTLKAVRKLLWDLRGGCGILENPHWDDCMDRIGVEIKEIGRRTKPWA